MSDIRQFPIVSAEVEEILDDYAVLGPAFLQCGKITGYIPSGVTLCGKPMMHEGKC